MAPLMHSLSVLQLTCSMARCPAMPVPLYAVQDFLLVRVSTYQETKRLPSARLPLESRSLRVMLKCYLDKLHVFGLSTGLLECRVVVC